MEKENAINFLLFSYFRITLESDTEDIINAAINRAYQDASRHVLSIPDDGENYRLKKSAREEIRNFINKALKSPDQYDALHREVCSNLITHYESFKSDDRKFTYGIAQKWVNMTMKYLCVVCSVLENDWDDHSFCQAYKKELKVLEPNLHVPVDSYILESAASKKKDYRSGFCIKIPQKTRKPDESHKAAVGLYSDNALPWSKWEPNDEEDYYDHFQKELKNKIKPENLLPLDWEGPAWIKVAKHRTEKEQERADKKWDSPK